MKGIFSSQNLQNLRRRKRNFFGPFHPAFLCAIFKLSSVSNSSAAPHALPAGIPEPPRRGRGGPPPGSAGVVSSGTLVLDRHILLALQPPPAAAGGPLLLGSGEFSFPIHVHCQEADQPVVDPDPPLQLRYHLARSLVEEQGVDSILELLHPVGQPPLPPAVHPQDHSSPLRNHLFQRGDDLVGLLLGQRRGGDDNRFVALQECCL